jgi:dTDP-4-amino-4,6-dideoxygalactose transaminase
MRRRLPLVDLRATLAPIASQLEAAAVRVLRGDRFVLGPEVAAFEAECAAYLGVPHAAGVSSGTDALYLALRALGVGQGDEVLVPVFGFVATAEAVVRTGAVPVFVDVRATCGRADLADADKRIGPRTRALVHVPLGGHGAGTAEAAAWARARGLVFVEDAAQSFGARDDGRAIGAFGDAAAFSFFPAKILGGFGDGGLVVSATAATDARARSLRQHGRGSDGTFVEAGTNARLDELQAALLRVRLAHLPRELEQRAAIARRYDEAFVTRGIAAPPACGCEVATADAPLALPPRCASASARGLYPVRARSVGARDALRSALDEAGIDTAVYYARLLVDEPCFAAPNRATSAETFPGAAELSARTLSLPLFPGMTEEEVARVVDAVEAAVAPSTSAR